MRLKAPAALCLTLLFVAVCALAGGPAQAQRSRRGQQTPAQSNTAPARQERPKQVIIGRGSDTARGSRMTITSDEALNDYSAYRSGDRFYVELPNANAEAAARAAGKGFTDLQVQRRGKNVVLSYRVQPGAKPRVEQRFNRLEVIFEAPEGEAARTAPQAQPTPQPTATQEAAQNNRPAGQTPAPNQNQADARRNAAENAAGQSPGAQQQTPAASNSAEVAAVQPPAGQSLPPEQSPSPVEQASPAQPAPQELAQALPPAPAAPVTTTTTAGASGTSIGAFLWNNWPMVFVAMLLLVGVGLLIAGRRAAAASPTPAEERRASAPAPVEAAPRKLAEADAPAAEAKTLTKARTTTDAGAVTDAGTVAGAGTVTEGKTAASVAAASLAAASAAAAKESKKVGRKAKKKAAAREEKKARAEERKVLAEEQKRPAEVQETPAAPFAETAAGLVSAPAVEEAAAAEEVETVETPAAEVAVEASPVVEPTPAEEVAAEVPEEAAAPAEMTVETPAETVEVSETTVEVSDEAAAAGLAVAGLVAAGAVAEEEEPAAATTFAEPADEAPAEVKELAAFETPTVEAETKEIAPATTEVAAVTPSVREAVLAEEATKEIAPVAAVFDADRVQAETKRLLDGEPYDRAVVSTGDAMARQLVAAELLSALAARNAERRERARAAYVEHGYFEEAAQDLRSAVAPAERSSAARSLGLVSDPAATPHLVAALEDNAVEVRRAAVESLASLRDPSAISPLEELLRREQKSKEKVNRKLVEHTISVCREAAAELETRAVAAPVVAPEETAETLTEEVAPAEAVEEVAPSVEAELDETPTLAAGVETKEIAPAETPAEVSTAGASTEPTAALFEEPRPFVPEVSEETPPVEEQAPETTAPLAGLSREVNEEVAASPYVLESPPAVEEVSEPEVVAESAAELVEPPAAPARQGEEWLELDMSELSAPAPSAPAAPDAFAFETSGGELVASEPAAAELPTREPSLFEEQTFEEREPAESTAVEAVETGLSVAEPAAAEESPAASFVAEEVAPAAEPSPSYAAEEKGVALFDEFSSVPANIQQRLASRDPEERAAAVAELARVDTGEAFQQVCAAFDDEAKEVRSAAARTLYEMPGDRADTFTRALREAAPDRRRSIGSAIAASGLASDAIGQLTGESREKTYEAFSLLFLMAKAGEVQPLVRAIEGHPNNEVRLAVVKLLALSGQKDILPAFRRLAVRGSLPTEVRSAVMEAIYQISSQSEPTPAA